MTIITVALSLALGLVCGGTSTTQAATRTTIRGRVVDAMGRAVPGVRVFLNPSVGSACTDAEGRYSIGRLPRKTEPAKVYAHAVGFRLAEAQVILGSHRTIDFSMASNGRPRPAHPTCRATRPLVAEDSTYVYGRVLDERHRPLTGARVDLVGFGQTVTTDGFGMFSLAVREPPTKAKRVRVRVSHARKEAKQLPVYLIKGEWRALDAVLAPEGAEGS